MIKRVLLIILSISLCCFLLLTEGCKKYEDGPLISLKTKKKRLVGIWLEESVNGATSLSSDPVYEEFKENKEYIRTSNSSTVTGTWSFDDKKEKIIINMLEIRILRLTSSEFWYESPYGSQGSTDEVHLKR